MRSAFARELGRGIEYHDVLPTTQTRARELAAQGASRGIVVANEQSAGQGTRGRVWVAPTRLASRVVSAMEEAAVAAGVPGRGRVVRVRAAGAQVSK